MLYLCARWNIPSTLQGGSLYLILYTDMAKSSSFFGLRRGSTKSLTFSVLDGRQITKDRVTDIKNPRTVMQMNQRCLIKTISLAYSCMKNIVDHSFEGYSYGSQSMRYFSSVNFPLVKAASYAANSVFGFAAFKDSSPNMGQFKISEGTLTAPQENAFVISFANNKMNLSIASEATNVEQLVGTLGIAKGDIVTTCALVQDKDLNARFVWIRLIIPAGASALTDVQVESNAPTSVDAERGISVAVQFTSDAGINANSAALYGIIRSQKAASGYKRSTAFLRSKIGEPVYRDSFVDAMATYPKGAEYILNGDNVSAFEGGEIVEKLPHNLTLKASSMVTRHSFNPESPLMAGTQVTLTAVTNGINNCYVKFPGGTTKQMTGSGNNWSLTFEMPDADTQLEIDGDPAV